MELEISTILGYRVAINIVVHLGGGRDISNNQHLNALIFNSVLKEPLKGRFTQVGI